MINELEALYKIKAFSGCGTAADQELLSPIFISISQKNCIKSEMPDIYGDGFGLEHTEVSPFYESRKKGSSYKRFNQIIKDSLRKLDLPLFEYHYLDISLFLDKLGVREKSRLAENTTKAIEEKSKKFLKYAHFELNGLWLSFPNYISIGENPALFLLQESIYKSLIKSPFDFFFYGNEHVTNVVTKSELIRQYQKNEPVENCVVTLISADEFPIFQIKCKELPDHLKSANVKVGLDHPDNFFNITNDINVPHCTRLFLTSDYVSNEEPKARLFSDDIELLVNFWSEENGSFRINFSSNYFSGELITDFNNKFSMNFTDLTMRPDEMIKIPSSQLNDSVKQRIFTGVKRFIVYSEGFYNIYVSPPYIKADMKFQYGEAS